MKFIKDESGSLEEEFDFVKDRFYSELDELKFLYVWRDSEKFDDDGMIIYAEVRKLSNRDRDIFGYDVAIEVWKDGWKKANKDERNKIIFHELRHIKIDEDEETGEIKYDKDDRVKYSLIPHDIVIRRFTEDLRKFGLSEQEDNIRVFLNSVHKEHKTDKNKTNKIKAKKSKKSKKSKSKKGEKK